jgi:hypothetical protein
VRSRPCGTRRALADRCVVRWADPYGYITSVDENRLSVPELMHKYVNDANLLKSVAMKKEVT